MKKIIPIVLIVGMFTWAVVEFIGTSTDDASEEGQRSGGSISSQPTEIVKSDEIGIQRGMIAPDFEVTTLAGEQVKLSDYRGSRVMLNFWATWCPPCRAEMPDMEMLYGKEDITILGVNMTSTESSEEVVHEFVDEFELTFPILLDQSSELTSTYKIAAYPTTYMIDSDGRIQFLTLGALNYDQMLQQLSRME